MEELETEKDNPCQNSEMKTPQSIRISDVVRQSLSEEIDRLLELAGPGIECSPLIGRAGLGPGYDSCMRVELFRCEDGMARRITLLKGQTTEMALRATIHWLHGFITAKQQFGRLYE